jgi:murein DD-endopeptidase MepM/ murein hydrolase activator NlpD
MPSEGRGAAASGVTWRWPVHGRIAGSFHLTPRTPFARGQRRGVDLLAPPRATVRAACPGQVTFSGRLPNGGLALSVRCGGLVATYLHLGRLDARRGTHVARGTRLGTLGPDGRLRLGARRATDRRGYVDPLTLLRDPRTTAPPTLGPAPRPRRQPPLPARTRPRLPATHATPNQLPWPAYPAIALIATALPVGSLIHHRRRRRTASVAVESAPPL